MNEMIEKRIRRRLRNDLLLIAGSAVVLLAAFVVLYVVDAQHDVVSGAAEQLYRIVSQS